MGLVATIATATLGSLSMFANAGDWLEIDSPTWGVALLIVSFLGFLSTLIFWEVWGSRWLPILGNR